MGRGYGGGYKVPEGVYHSPYSVVRNVPEWGLIISFDHDVVFMDKIEMASISTKRKSGEKIWRGSVGSDDHDDDKADSGEVLGREKMALIDVPDFLFIF